MINVPLQDAQRELPTLADRALRGEEVFITVGQETLRLSITTNVVATPVQGPRPGYGEWKGRVAIPDEFYASWTDEEIGESEG